MISHAFIFARGGSKGLPRKNLKLLAGKPLIQYSIEIARQLDEIDRIFVSTEDEEIAEVSTSLGAELILRPKELSTDESPEWLAWQHAIEWVESRYDKFDEFISLPTTSPLRSKSDVQKAIKQRRKTTADSCVSISTSSKNPYFNMVKYDQEGYLELVSNHQELPIFCRQQAPEVFDITTVAYVTTPSFIVKNNSLFDGCITSISVPKERAVDIDDIYDFMFAETLVKGSQAC